MPERNRGKVFTNRAKTEEAESQVGFPNTKEIVPPNERPGFRAAKPLETVLSKKYQSYNLVEIA